MTHTRITPVSGDIWSKEYWLKIIAQTGGMECASSAFDENLEELIREGKVHRGPGRGPGSVWHRLTRPGTDDVE